MSLNRILWACIRKPFPLQSVWEAKPLQVWAQDSATETQQTTWKGWLALPIKCAGECIWHSKPHVQVHTVWDALSNTTPMKYISCAPDAASYTLESIVECVGCPHSNVLAVAIECMISYQLFTLRYTFMSWCIGHAFYKHCIAAKLHAHVTLTTLGVLMKNIDPSMKLYVFDRNGHKKCL